MLLGDFVVWLYQDLAGFKADPADPAYKHIIMKPYPVGNLKFVKASYLSPYGPIKSEWRLKGNIFSWDISVPANTTATIYVPARNESKVTEGGRNASDVAGIKFLGVRGDRAIYEVGSGNYRFVSIDGRISK